MLYGKIKNRNYIFTFAIFFLSSLVVCLVLPLLLFSFNLNTLVNIIKSIKSNIFVEGFTTIFLSIILEALPFIILGTFISSIIQVFVSEETITKLIPKNKFFGSLLAGLIGLIFPVCDCAIVPIARRLIKKGVSSNVAVTFMLAAPIVNPIVLASTYYAFPNMPYVVFIRGILGLISAMIIGNFVQGFDSQDQKKTINIRSYKLNQNASIHKPILTNEHNAEECMCGCGHTHHHMHEKLTIYGTISDVIDHTSIELHDVGKFIILGAFLSAFTQTVLPRKLILTLGNHIIYSILAMMLIAFLLAICSQTDAFIARTFVNQFTFGSIIAFLIFGPMIDIKNAFMIGSSFNKKFLIMLIFIITLVCFTIGLIINVLILKGGFLL